MQVARQPVVDQSTGIPHHVTNRHTRYQARKGLVPLLVIRNFPNPFLGLWADATAWAFPWGVFTYPGHYKGILAVLGRSVSISSIGHWKRSNRPAPWACKVMRDYIARRCEAGQDLVTQLDAYIAECEAKPGRRPQRSVPDE